MKQPKYSLRFNPNPEWSHHYRGNRYLFGLMNFISLIEERYIDKKELKICEIGSYKGESTFLFAASNIFTEIHCIDPFVGDFDDSDITNNWDEVKREFWTNTRYFNNIKLHQDFSYNMASKFPDNYFDVVYIDGSHDYEDVKQDIELFLPKISKNGIISGHDYTPEIWGGVIQAVDEKFGADKIYKFPDESWAYFM